MRPTGAALPCQGAEGHCCAAWILCSPYSILVHPLPAAVFRTSVEGEGVCLAAHSVLCPAMLTCPNVCTAAPQMQSMLTASWTSSRWTAGAGQWTGPISQTSEPCSLLHARMAAAAVLAGYSLGCATVLLLWLVPLLVLCILSSAGLHSVLAVTHIPPGVCRLTSDIFQILLMG